jgi:hypothetical protein
LSAFLLTLCVLLTGFGLMGADYATGSILHGSDYQPPFTDLSLPEGILPARLRAVLFLLRGEYIEEELPSA